MDRQKTIFCFSVEDCQGFCTVQNRKNRKKRSRSQDGLRIFLSHGKLDVPATISLAEILF